MELSGVEAVDITVEDSGMEGGVARDSEALTLLDNPHTRAAILNELMEVRPAAGGTVRPAAGGTVRPAAGGTVRPAAGGPCVQRLGDRASSGWGTVRPAAGGPCVRRLGGLCVQRLGDRTSSGWGTVRPAAGGPCVRRLGGGGGLLCVHCAGDLWHQEAKRGASQEM